MSVVDVDGWAAPLSEDAPCGEDLEYDPLFVEMEHAAQGRAAQEMGDVATEAEDPDWRAVRKACEQLFSRTRDLRVTIYLARALLHTEGWTGFADALDLLRRLVVDHWDAVHPELDHEDNDDATMRLNTLLNLCDRQALLRSVRLTPIVSSRGLGRFCLRDIDLASGRLDAAEGGGERTPDMAAIDAAFLDCELGELQETADALRLALESVHAVASVVSDKVGAAQAPNLDELAGELGRIVATLDERLSRRGAGPGEGTEVEGGGASAVAVAGAAREAAVSGAVNSREEVIRVLDLVCQYYSRQEPSSPVPLLLRRAKRLVSKDFLEILRDMAPDGVSQAEIISGTRED